MSALDIERLAKICGMLGSGHAGERASAALKATAMLAEAGMTWEAFIRGKIAINAPAPEPKRTKRAPEQATPSFDLKPHAALARELLDNYFPAYINQRAAEFLRDVAGKMAYRELSEPQQAYLRDIRRQCERMARFRKKGASSQEHASSL